MMYSKGLFFMLFCAVTSANRGSQSFSEDDKSSSLYELIILTLVWIVVLILVLPLIAICIRACRRLKNKRRSKNMDVELEGALIDCNKWEESKKPTNSFDNLNENNGTINIKIGANENSNGNLENVAFERSDATMSPSVGWKFPGEKTYSIETVDQTVLYKIYEASVPVDDENIDMKNLMGKLKNMKLTSDQEHVVDILSSSNRKEDTSKVEITVEEVNAGNTLMTTELTKALYKDFQSSIKSDEPAVAESTSPVTTNTKDEFQKNDKTEPSTVEPEPEIEIPKISELSSSDSNTITDHFETKNSSDNKISAEKPPQSTLSDSQVTREESHFVFSINPPPALCSEEDIKAEFSKLGIPHTDFIRFFNLNKVPVPVCAVGSQDNSNQLIIT